SGTPGGSASLRNTLDFSQVAHPVIHYFGMLSGGTWANVRVVVTTDQAPTTEGFMEGFAPSWTGYLVDLAHLSGHTGVDITLELTSDTDATAKVDIVEVCDGIL
ncbi:MAG: hypothetical protein JRH20_33060, partial [Deltaproteobacteria bacterium]|nr:hypothetical protein [Deltaproteobacteria bacterium]